MQINSTASLQYINILKDKNYKFYKPVLRNPPNDTLWWWLPLIQEMFIELLEVNQPPDAGAFFPHHDKPVEKISVSLKCICL